METVAGPHSFTVRLVKRHWLAPGIVEFGCARPQGFTFTPGQFMRFEMPGYQRDYTMVSAPDAPTLDFCLKIRKNGRFSETIINFPMGHRFDVTGPLGYFTYHKSKNLGLFVATGTGISPFVAFCRSQIAKALLIHGVESADQLVYRPLLQGAVKSYIPCISKDIHHNSAKESNVFTGRVTDYLARELAPGNYDFYLCGNGKMIRDATALIDDRFESSRVYIENFD